MEAIFMRPLSIVERNSVWALILLTSTTPSASEAILSMYTGTPRSVSSSSTTSIEERIGAPQSPSVTTHRRHDKRLRFHLLQDRDETAQDPVYLRDASAPSSERHAHTWPDGRSYLFPAQLLSQLRFDALDARPGKPLPDLDNLGELHL